MTIYNVPTQKMADSLANADPMFKAGRLAIETHSWRLPAGLNLDDAKVFKNYLLDRKRNNH